MAGKQQNVGGIAISLVADATQLKTTMDEALGSVGSRKVKVTLTAERDKSFQEAIDYIRRQRVALDLTFSPRRETIRQLKRDIQAGIEAERGIVVPVKLKSFTKAEGQAIRDEIEGAVGTPTIEMVVNWRWGENGPPPSFLTGGGGGGGGGFFFGPVQGGFTNQRQQPAGGRQQQQTGPLPQRQAQQPPEEQGVAEPPTRPPRQGTRLKRREDETDLAYEERLLDRREELLQRLDSKSERTKARANNEIARIDKILGKDQGFERVKVPEKGRLPGDQTQYPERVGGGGQRQRGGPSIGPLAATGESTNYEKAARLFFENYAKREKPDTLIESREKELQDLRKERTRMEGALAQPKRSSLYRGVTAEIAEKEAALAEITRPQGFRGQRVSRSFFSEGIAPVRAPSERAALAAAFREPSSMDEFISALKEVPDQFGAAFTKGLELVKQGKLGEALESTRGARDELLARGRGGKIPGVTRGAVQRVQDPTKELQRVEPRDTTPEAIAAAEQQTQQQAAFAFEVETLQDLIGAITTVQEDATRAAKKKRTPKRNRRATTAPLQPPDDLKAEAEAARAEVESIGRQLENARSSPSDVVDEKMLALLTSPGRRRERSERELDNAIMDSTDRFFQGEGRFGQMEEPTTLERLRAAAARQRRNPTVPLEKLLPKSIREAPELAAIMGGFIKAQAPSEELLSDRSLYTQSQADKARARSVRGQAELERTLARTPEELSRTTGPVDRGRINELEASLAAAKANLADVNERRAAATGAGAPLPQAGPTLSVVEDIADAIDEAVPPPIQPNEVNFGPPGEGGGFGFFGGGGALPVNIVQSIPLPIAGIEAGTAAAGPVQGGGPEDRAMRESLQKYLEEQAAAAKEEKAAKTKAPREPPEPGIPTPGRPIATRLRELTPVLGAERIEGALSEARGPRPIDTAIADVQQALAEARQGLPIRSPAVSIAQSFAGGPRGAIVARFQEANQLLVKARGIKETEEDTRTLLTAQEDAYAALNERKQKGAELTGKERVLFERLPGEIKQSKDEIDRLNLSAKGFIDQAAGKAALTSSEKLANLGRSFAGNIVGTLGYGAALGAVVGGLALVSKGLGPVVERMGGYQNVTAALNNELAEQQKQQGGSVDALVAGRLAATNMSGAVARLVQDQLAQTAATQASAAAIQEQTEFLAGAGNAALADQRAGSRRLSSNQNLYESTGGLFNTSLFAPTFSVQEALARQMDEAFRQQVGNAPIDWKTGRVGQVPAAGTRGPQNQVATGAGGGVNIAFEALQRQIGTAPGGLRLQRGAPEDVARTAAAFRQADFGELAKSAQRAGYSLEGLSKDSDRAAIQVTNLVSSLSRQAQGRNVDLLLQAAQPQIQALRFGVENELQNQLQTFLPAQRGLQFAAQPLPAFGTTFAPQQVSGLQIGGQTKFQGVPPEVISTFDQYRDEAEAAIDAINAKAAEGQQVLTEKLGVPESVLAELSGLGTRIQEINAQQNAIRLDLQYSQFNRQLFLANRTLGDLAGLTGRAGATQIGLLQREQLILGRRSQALQLQSQQLGLQTAELQQQSSILGQQANKLQLMLSQRQINFQRAIAGFTAPGLTPEERAARIEEAKLEADFAQKQLNIQREQFKIQNQQIAINREQIGLQREGFALAQAQFANQVALQDATNERAYQDQLAAIAELKKAFDASVQLAALEELKGVLQKQADLLTEEIKAQVEAEEQFIKAQGQFSQDLMAQTGQFVVGTVQQVERVFDQTAAAFANSGLGRWLGLVASGGGTGTLDRTIYTDDEGNRTVGPHAAGFLGQVNQRTRMEVGEAGTETVAILRNPRQMFATLEQAGGGNVIQVLVTGNQISNDADEERLARRVAREVESILGRRATQQGFRFAAR